MNLYSDNQTCSMDSILQTVSAFLPLISDNIAELVVLDTVRDFCTKTQFAHRDVVVELIDGVRDYTLEIPEGLEVVGIQAASVEAGCAGRVNITPMLSFRAPDLLEISHDYFVCGAYDDVGLMNVTISVAPIPGAKEVPIEVERRAQAIASGALLRLGMLPTQSIYNGTTAEEKKAALKFLQTTAAYHQQVYTDAIREESHRRVWGMVRGMKNVGGYGLL